VSPPHHRQPGGRPFELEGRFLRRADGLAIDAAELRFRDTVIGAAGALGEPPELLELALTLEASGPDLGLLSPLVGIDLPRRRFSLRGGVAREGDAFRLDAVEGRLDDVGVTAIPPGARPGSRLRAWFASRTDQNLASIPDWAVFRPNRSRRVDCASGRPATNGGVEASVGRLTAGDGPHQRAVSATEHRSRVASGEADLEA
jgi:hypothetical protein